MQNIDINGYMEPIKYSLDTTAFMVHGMMNDMDIYPNIYHVLPVHSKNMQTGIW